MKQIYVFQLASNDKEDLDASKLHIRDAENQEGFYESDVQGLAQGPKKFCCFYFEYSHNIAKTSKKKPSEIAK